MTTSGSPWADPRTETEEVARRLGYAEAASFTHAFSRWKGIPPGAWARASGTLPG